MNLMSKQLDVLGIGNAIVDVFRFVDDGLLEDIGLSKGTMTLVESEDDSQIDEVVKPVAQLSGGSIANTLFCIAFLGGHCHFIGKVGNDELGRLYAWEMEQAGVRFATAFAENGSTTGRCDVYVTHDAERTMRVSPGAMSKLSVRDFNEEAIKNAKILLLEGYLLDLEWATELIEKSMEIAQHNNTEIAISLSDPQLVERHRNKFLQIVETHAELVFANELEAYQLCQTNNLSDTLAFLQTKARHAIVTRSENGSVAVSNGEQFVMEGQTISKVVDTTGAGDAYAGGFLFQYTREEPIRACMETATKLASEVIQHIGARVDAKLPPR